MGGHKQGGQRGHHSNHMLRRGSKGASGHGRNCHPDDRAQIGRGGLDVPGEDLRRAGQRLEDNKHKREARIRAIREEKAVKAGKFGHKRAGGATSDRHALAAMALQAARGQSDFANRAAAAAAGSAAGAGTVELSLKKYSKEFKSVIEQSDVLLMILDARDPLGCRLFEFEQAVQSQYGDAKRFVMLLNKADMLPDPSVLEAWVQHFALEGIPAIPFTARPCRHTGFDRCVPEVFKLLRKLGRVDDSSNARKSLTVGVIGYPNVGKSSTINALKGKSVVSVGNMPGVTTGNTEVELRRDIKIIDCPGVVVRGADGADVVLRNAAKLSDVEDPLLVIESVLQRCDVAVLCAVYGVPLPSAVGNPVNDFLRAIALKRGRLHTGGQIALVDAANTVLKDWNDGRIVHYTTPPESSMGFHAGAGQHEIGEAPELLTTLSKGPSMLPAITVVPPTGALPAEWSVPESKKFTGKIRYSYLDTSSDDEEEEDGDDDGAAGSDDSDEEA